MYFVLLNYQRNILTESFSTKNKIELSEDYFSVKLKKLFKAVVLYNTWERLDLYIAELFFKKNW